MKKHIIIAGAPRAGKTTLSLELIKLGYIHYKMDSIKRGIFKIFNIDNDDWEYSSQKMAELIDIMLNENITDTVKDKEFYILDTPHLQPKDVKLIKEKNILVIFLGYSQISPLEELKLIRKYDKENYWSSKVPDDEMLKLVEQNIKYSELIKDECKRLNIPYFDTSHDREKILEEAKKYIIEKGE